MLYCPTAIASSARSRRRADRRAAHADGGATKNVFACWMGDAQRRGGRAQLVAAQACRTYETPERAVRAFMHLVVYRASQELLMETPSGRAERAGRHRRGARGDRRQALADGREWLDAAEASAVLALTASRSRDRCAWPMPQAAARGGRAIRRPVALKILLARHHAQIRCRRRDARISTDAADGRRRGRGDMLERVARQAPRRAIDGFIVQPMVDRARRLELIVGISTDATFGPVILFGHGGTAVEVVRDTALELPPLNTALARAHDRAHAHRTSCCKGYRDRPAADIDGVVNVLARSLSQIAADHAEVAELDINPLLCDAAGRDRARRRIRVRAASGPGAARFAIRPYPQRARKRDRVDASGQAFACARSSRKTSRRCSRFADESTPDDLWHALLRAAARAHARDRRAPEQIDYDREMTLVAWDGGRVAGLARSAADPNFEAGECAVIIRADLREKGLARQMFQALMRAIASQGVRRAVLVFPADQTRMLTLAGELGFESCDVAGRRVAGAREQGLAGLVAARGCRRPLRLGQPMRDPLPGLVERLLPDEQAEMMAVHHLFVDVVRGRADQMLGRKQLRRRDQLIVARRQQEQRRPYGGKIDLLPKATKCPPASSLRLYSLSITSR